MTDFISSVFKGRKPDAEALRAYGFNLRDGRSVYETRLPDTDMIMTVSVCDGAVSADVSDDASGEKYFLHLTDVAAGSFVGAVKSGYERVLGDIAEKCFVRDAFKSSVADELMALVKSRLGDEPEFLWKNPPDCAVLRRKDCNKWYAIIMAVARSKIGIDGDGTAEIITLRNAQSSPAADGKRYFPAYHMNKKNLLSVTLDGDVPVSEVFALVSASYRSLKK